MKVELFLSQRDDDALDYEALGMKPPEVSIGDLKSIPAYIRASEIETVWVLDNKEGEKIIHLFFYNDPDRGLPVKYSVELEKELEEELNRKR